MMGFSYRIFLLQVAMASLVSPFSFQTSGNIGASIPNDPLSFDEDSSACELNIELKKASCGNKGLDEVPQSLSEDIVRFDLFRNNITFLLNSSFERYPLVTYLDLSRNDISAIHPTTFHPLNDLTHLDISFNQHLVLPDSGFLRWASKLSILNLYSSNLESLPDDMLKWSPLLGSVRLFRNNLSVVNISSCGTSDYFVLSDNHIDYLTPDTFNFGCHVGHLELDGNPIRTVDPDVIGSLQVRTLVLGDYPMTFEVLRNLFIGISRSVIEELSFIGFPISSIPKDFFDPLRDYSLSFLEFTYHNVNVLYPFVFSNLTNVTELVFSDGYLGLDTIEPDYFKGMQGLRVLKMEYSQLRYINPGSQTWTVDLIELHLVGNSFSGEIYPHAFLGLRNLILLDLTGNERLDTITKESFSGLDSIQTIDLSECSVFRLRLDTLTLNSLSLNNMVSPYSPLVPGESFKQTRYLVNLRLRDSTVHISNVWDATFNVSLFDGLFNLTILDLGENLQLGSYSRDIFPSSIFRQLSALQELSLDHCGISNLHPLAFTGLESLKDLDLRGNRIQHLHFDLLQGLVQVTNLHFQGNLLSYLDESLFSNNSRLAILSLANNKLTSLNQSTFKPIKSSVESVDLSINPIDCNCDLKWLIVWSRGPTRLLNQDKTICSLASIRSVRGKPLLGFDPDEYCRLNILLVCLPALAVICLLIVVGFVYHNRWQLRFKLYLLKLAALGYNEIRDARDHMDYEFDVDIIYYDDDDDGRWIREHLRPAFEERLPQFQRNVFGDEDLVLGMHYLDSVDYVVSHSYKTIIVLSRAAVRDRWFMLKFRIAMDHVSDTQTEFVVVVFLEDIPDEEIPFLARLYLSDGRPYLHWTNDQRGQEYFWHELVKNLTINLRTNDLIPNE